MSLPACPSCNAPVSFEFRFCPGCGYDLEKPNRCRACGYVNDNKSKFCQECGASLVRRGPGRPRLNPAAPEARSAVEELEPPPTSGITIEFAYSSALAFDFAVKSAREFATFKQFGQEKKAIYRVTIQANEMNSVMELVEHLKGWRRRAVYVDGEKVTWDSVFAFSWCFGRKQASFKPEYYCFGYENQSMLNVWGCIHSGLTFNEWADWFCWGRWISKDGDWAFDKDRIRHELQRALHPYRYCPALQATLVEDALRALPDVVNPTKDKNWKFVEKYGDDVEPGLVITSDRYGYREKVTMKGVAPNGPGALNELTKRMNFRLPTMR